MQKAPAATIEVLAEAMKRVFNADNPVRLLGTRHGEKLYETLLTREEMARAEDLGDYYRVPADARDLNYDSFFTEGEVRVSETKTTIRTTRVASMLTAWQSCCVGSRW